MILQLKKHQIAIGSALLLCCTFMIGYIIPKNNFPLEIGFFALGIAGFLFLSKLEDIKLSFRIGLIIRLVLLISTPLLSDDYLRFLWDGYLTSEGINPFDYKPYELSEAFKESTFASELYEGVNSKNNYSFFPPVNQWIFYLSSLTGNLFGGILILRLFIIGFEIGTFLTIQKILVRFRISIQKLNLYWLNPLVVLELTGNLHTEGILIFFLLTGLLSLSKLQDFKGGILLGLSFCSRIFSFMFFPLLLLKSRTYRGGKMLLGIVPVLIFAFIPFINFTTIIQSLESLNLYFQTFEFNGSLFNLFKAIGIHLYGYDPVQTFGPLLSIISGGIILLLSWRYRFRNRKIIFTGITLMICTYFFFSSSVHPWYIIIPLALSLFTSMRFPLVWSFTVFLSYSFYDDGINLPIKNTLITIEYVVVFLVFFFDVKRLRSSGNRKVFYNN